MTATARLAEFEATIHESLRSFFETGYAAHQGRVLVELPEWPDLHVDFDGSFSEGWEATLEMMSEQGLDADARETVDHDGRACTPIAWLFDDEDASEPVGAYLAHDVSDPTAAVLFVDPSGDVHEFAADFASFLARLGGS